ncbi:hypothetical protein EBZ38_04345 [bacterium]|nr:hypothetical protein [bacterium]
MISFSHTNFTFNQTQNRVQKQITQTQKRVHKQITQTQKRVHKQITQTQKRVHKRKDHTLYNHVNYIITQVIQS